MAMQECDVKPLRTALLFRFSRPDLLVCAVSQLLVMAGRAELFAVSGISNELVRQLDEIASHLKPGSVFKERMFLADGLKKRLSPQRLPWLAPPKQGEFRRSRHPIFPPCHNPAPYAHFGGRRSPIILRLQIGNWQRPSTSTSRPDVYSGRK